MYFVNENDLITTDDIYMSEEGNLTVKLNNEAMNMQELFMGRDRDLIKSYYKTTEHAVKSI